jgi:hypothetical protein
MLKIINRYHDSVYVLQPTYWDYRSDKSNTTQDAYPQPAIIPHEDKVYRS